MMQRWCSEQPRADEMTRMHSAVQFKAEKPQQRPEPSQEAGNSAQHWLADGGGEQWRRQQSRRQDCAFNAVRGIGIRRKSHH